MLSIKEKKKLGEDAYGVETTMPRLSSSRRTFDCSMNLLTVPTTVFSLATGRIAA